MQHLSALRSTAIAVVGAMFAALAAFVAIAPAAADAPALTASATSVVQGDTITFAFADPAEKSSAKNWIGVYAGKTSCYNASTYWNYTNSGTQTAGSDSVASGSMSFATTSWAVGTYSACLLYNDASAVTGNTNGAILGSVTFTVVPTVTSATATIGAGDLVTFDFATPSGKSSAKNWIGVYAKSTCATPSAYWAYTNYTGTVSGTNGRSAGSTAKDRGSLTFDTTGWAAGTYAVCLVYNDTTGTFLGGTFKLTVVAGHDVSVTRSGEGTAAASATSAVPVGTVVRLTATPATGYDFTGWTVTTPDDGSVVIADDAFTMPSVAVAVQATFTPHAYTVRFDGNGADEGTPEDQALVVGSAQPLAENVYARAGYHFAGWATTPGGAPVYADAASVLDLSTEQGAIVSLYAVWHGDVPAAVDVPDADVVDVDWASGAPVDHAQGLAITTTGTPTVALDETLGKPAATFDGSASAYQVDFTNQFSKLTSHFTMECQFRWNGAELATLKASAYPSICSDEQSAGFNIEVYNNKLNASIYAGGYKYAYAAADAVVPGKWYDAVAVFDQQSLKLYLDGVLVATTAVTSAMTAPTAAQSKLTLGADTNSTGGPEQFAPVSLSNVRVWSAALTAEQVAQLPARYDAHAVTVSKSGQGEATATPGSAVRGDLVQLAQTAATGYRFTGWSVVDPGTGVAIGTDATITMPAQAVTVAADFAANEYTVRFDGNGADGGELADEAFVYDTAQALAANAFTRDGHYLAGWATSADGRPLYADGASVRNLSATDGGIVTLYAIWVADGEYLVSIEDAAHGTATSDLYSAAPLGTVTLRATPDEGYHLVGWTVEEPAEGVEIAEDGTFTMPANGVVVHADFAPNTYTVRFDGNGADGGAMSDATLTVDAAAALPAVGFIRAGHAFAGWATSATGAVVYADGASVTNLAVAQDAIVTLYAIWSLPQAGSWPSLAAGFVADTLKLPAVPTSGTVNQALPGLWNGTAPTSYTKASGDDWLSVTADGTVIGTAPSAVPQDAGELVVQATNGTTTSTILVEVPVDAHPTLKAASWNAWANGASVTDATAKNLAAIAARGLGVIGFQDGAAMAQQVAAALGWYAGASGDLGIVSAYPIVAGSTVPPTAGTPALAVALDVHGTRVRVWDAYLDEAASDPEARAAQAQAVVAAVQADAAAAETTPVILLGDLGTADLAAAVTAGTGLVDAWAAANDGATGSTWPVFAAQAANASRIDVVLAGGSALHLVGADELSVGWPSETAPAGNSWASDHAAVVATFSVGGAPAEPIELPTVAVGKGTVGYQVGHGPADAAAFLAAIGASTGADDAVLAVDLHGVDFGAVGWYTAQVTAAAHGLVSNAVAVAVRVAPVPTLALTAGTMTVSTRDTVTAGDVLAALQPYADVPVTYSVDLAEVAAGPGGYPVSIVATDEWGFRVEQAATLQVEAGTYTVAFDSGDGSAVASQSVGYGAKATRPADPTREGYAFAGWYPSEELTTAFDFDAETVTADLTLHAAWTPVSAPTTGLVQGFVTEASGPRAGIIVYVYAHGDFSHALAAATTNADGWYGLDIATGSYDLVFVDPAGEHPSSWWTGSGDGASTQAGAVAVQLTGDGAIASQRLAVAATGLIQGFVTAGGVPAAGVVVYAYAHGDFSHALYATVVNADGWYGITAAAGSYDLAFFDPAGQLLTQWWSTDGPVTSQADATAAVLGVEVIASPRLAATP